MIAKDEVRQRILRTKIVPVIRAESAASALSAARAVCAGGIPIVEVTLTCPGAIDVIVELTHCMGGQTLVGAGTVLDVDAAQRCLRAGAQFLVSPGYDDATVQFAKDNGVLIMAGGLTPTEVITAWKAGADFVKIFPCGNVGGPSYIRALKAALPDIPMVPTGGVNLSTARAFLDAGASAVGVGGELISRSALASGDFESITDAARQFTSVVRSM